MTNINVSLPIALRTKPGSARSSRSKNPFSNIRPLILGFSLPFVAMSIPIFSTNSGEGGFVMNWIRRFMVMLSVFLLIAGFPTLARAAWVSEGKARSVAARWLKESPAPMGELLGTRIRELTRYSGKQHGDPGYYVAFLDPKGWLIIPGDDTFEPVLAFGADFLPPDRYERSPLYFLLRIESPTQKTVLSTSERIDRAAKSIETEPMRDRRWQALGGENVIASSTHCAVPASKSSDGGRDGNGNLHGLEEKPTL
ncbi:hypothetical protein EII26_05250 [Fretibacterium sp. OH1220_COT-178]|nr:hypothetical protein EII26_05250 [Fretibacterium sp. OH1220_COT-178]